MFDLEQAIAKWRRQMRAAGIKAPALLDELESHLRKEMEQQIKSGLGEEKAFAKAVESIGEPGSLKREFAKVGAAGWTRLAKLKWAMLRFIGIPLPAQYRLSPVAREVLELGGKEALGFHHDFIGTEHVLLGLLELKQGVVFQVLRRMGVDGNVVRQEIEKFVGNGPVNWSAHATPYTPRARKALALAGKEAMALKQSQVGAEHIFLGLLQEGHGVAALVLKALGVKIETAREEIIKELGRN